MPIPEYSSQSSRRSRECWRPIFEPSRPTIEFVDNSLTLSSYAETRLLANPASRETAVRYVERPERPKTSWLLDSGSLAPLEISPLRLFPFQRFKQRFEIAGSETFAAVAPYHFVENRWPILDRLAENLE
jgi:hypothetical protein